MAYFFPFLGLSLLFDTTLGGQLMGALVYFGSLRLLRPRLFRSSARRFRIEVIFCTVLLFRVLAALLFDFDPFASLGPTWL